MRSDMHKVVVEKPRSGSDRRSLKTRWSLRDYDPEHEYDVAKWMSSARHRQYGWNAKSFTDVLSPLFRYLHKQVGRPWNKVYSEMKASLDSRTVTGRHVFDHAMWAVKRYCHLKSDGRVYPNVSGFKGNTPVEGLYVHPMSGLLCLAEPQKAVEAPADSPKRIKVDPSTEFVLEKGVWWLETFVALDPEEVVGRRFDRLTGKEVDIRRKDLQDAPKRRRVARKQANKKELKVLRGQLQMLH